MDALETLLTDPATFFGERSGEPSAKGPVLVVATVGILAGLASIPQFRLVLSSVDTGASAGSAIIVANVVGIGLTVVKPFVMWGLWSGVIFAVSYVFNGSGSFWTLAKLVGWAFVPHAFEKVLDIVLNVYRFQIRGIEPPANATTAAFEEFIRAIGMGPAAVVAAAAGILFTVWSAYLMYHAAREARGLDRIDAVTAVGAPLSVSLFFLSQLLLGAL
jgi:hypothetical protein